MESCVIFEEENPCFLDDGLVEEAGKALDGLDEGLAGNLGCSQQFGSYVGGNIFT